MYFLFTEMIVLCVSSENNDYDSEEWHPLNWLMHNNRIGPKTYTIFIQYW